MCLCIAICWLSSRLIISSDMHLKSLQVLFYWKTNRLLRFYVAKEDLSIIVLVQIILIIKDLLFLCCFIIGAFRLRWKDLLLFSFFRAFRLRQKDLLLLCFVINFWTIFGQVFWENQKNLKKSFYSILEILFCSFWM